MYMFVHRESKSTFQKSDIDTDNNIAYECVKEKSQEDDLEYEVYIYIIL